MSASNPTVGNAKVSTDVVAGAALVAIGATVVAQWLVPGADRLLFITISAISLVAFAVSRQYGFAVVAGATAGMGAMVLIVTSTVIDPNATGSVFFLALSAGLAAIWPLGRAARPRRTGAWPVVTAAALATLGSFLAVRQAVAFDGAQIGIAVVLVVAGAALILRRAISAKVSGRSAA